MKKKSRADDLNKQIERDLRRQHDEAATGSANIPSYEMVPIKKPVKKSTK